MNFPSSTAGAGATMGIGMLSSLFTGLGERQAGQQEKAAYDYNAAVDLQTTADQAVATEQQYATLVGRQATAYAAAGVDITRGSPLLMMAATAGRGGMQQSRIIQAGQERAALEKYYGRMAAWRGTMAGIGSFLGGISKSAQGFLDATGYIPGSSSFATDSVAGNYSPDHGLS